MDAETERTTLDFLAGKSMEELRECATGKGISEQELTSHGPLESPLTFAKAIVAKMRSADERKRARRQPGAAAAGPGALSAEAIGGMAETAAEQVCGN